MSSNSNVGIPLSRIRHADSHGPPTGDRENRNVHTPTPRIRHTDTEERRLLTEEHLSSPSQEVTDRFQYSFSLDADAPDVIQPPWKRDLHALLEQPTSSSSAFFVHVLMSFLIVTSAIITVLETVPAFHSISGRVWFGLETSLVALFTLEYMARCLAWSATWLSLAQWVFSFFGIIDLLAIFPYYIELMLRQDTSVYFRFSILRTFRLLRVFRPFRHNNTILLTIEVMYLSVRRSQHALLAIGFFVVMVLTVFSTLLYFAERGTWDATLETFINASGDPSQFASIPAAAWFVLVTITTVGYGEITPRSFLGRLITLPLLVFGLLLIALPSFVLGREFSIVWERMSKKRDRGEEEGNPPTHQSLHLFSSSNSDGSQPDLPNHNLAEDHAELSRQISELRVTVEAQGEMVKSLLDVLGQSKGKARERG